MNHTKNFSQTFGRMVELLLEPAMVLSNEAVSRTETEAATFLWDATDADTNVVLTRDTEYDAAGLVVSHTAWSLSNGPTVSAVVTDQPNNDEVSLSGPTVFTITGTNFGAQDADLEVTLRVTIADTHRGPHPAAAKSGRYTDGKAPVKMLITAVNVGDTEITASVDLSEYQIHGHMRAGVGDCEVQVRNTKRRLQSDRFSGLTVVK